MKHFQKSIFHPKRYFCFMNILIIGHVWPEPHSSAAGSRMMQLIEVFLLQGWSVHFASASAKGERAENLEELGVKEHSIKINDSGFDAFLSDQQAGAKALKPKIVLFDRFMVEEQFGWRIRENCPDALCILDTEDLHGLRKARENTLKTDRPSTKTDLLNDTAKREIASIYRSDLTLVISEAEMELLKTFFGVPERLLFYLPFMVKKFSKTDMADLKSFEQRTDFMTIGNFRHLPNLDAVRYLKKEIWPLTRKRLPGAKLHIYGAYPTQEVLGFHNKKEGFLVHGYAQSAAEVIQNARICLTPVRIGAGLKGKILESMLFGTPCVTTRIGAEGMFGQLPPNGAVADNPEKLANDAVNLYTDIKSWEQAQQNGFEVINARFDRQKWMPLFVDQVKSTAENLEAHRIKNFTGAMLNHQSLQATKYMSRWIEEKNKPR